MVVIRKHSPRLQLPSVTRRKLQQHLTQILQALRRMEEWFLMECSRRYRVCPSGIQAMGWAMWPVWHGRSVRPSCKKAKRRRVPAAPESAKRTAALQRSLPEVVVAVADEAKQA